MTTKVPDLAELRPVAGQLHVTDLGLAAAFIRLGRIGLDLLAGFLFAPIGLFALFLAMFSVIFALALTLEEGFRRAGWNAGADFLGGLNADIPLAGIAGAVLGLVVVLAVVGAVVTAARAPRVWGIAVTLLLALMVALLAHEAGADPERSSTWTKAALLVLLSYGAGATALAAAALLLAGIVARRRSPTGRIVQKWPRFSIAIFVARYGLGSRDFWRHLLRNLGRLVLVSAGLAILFVGSIFVLAALAAKSLPLFGLVADDWHPIFFIMDIVLWAAVAVMSVAAAVRSPAARIANGAVALFALFASGEIAILFRTLTLDADQLGLFFSPVSQDDLELLSTIALVWLFRGLVSHTLTKAYGDLKRGSARTASALARTRPEPPILFLRSFMDDEQLVPSSDALLAFAFGATRAKVRLEEIVAEIMFARGPLVALANPSVRSAPLGAARDVTADADWQDKVLSFLQASQIVVCFLGKTESFLWEIDNIVALGKLEATLIVLPPTYPHDRQLVHDAPKLARLIGLRDEADERARLTGARVLVFDAATGAFRAVRSGRADSFSYREAILIGGATILRNAARRAGPSAATSADAKSRA